MGDSKQGGKVPPLQVILAPRQTQEPRPIATPASVVTDQKVASNKLNGEDKPSEGGGGQTPIKPLLTKRELRLQRVMKPLTDKCIPDHGPRIISDSKYKAPPRVAPRKPGQTREQDEIRHRSSKLVFTMPNVRPPEVIEALKREKWINKLIKYMKKSWRVKVDPRQPDRDLDFRSTEAVHTKKADNWEELMLERDQLIDKRGETSKQRGFFCGYDANYPPIYSLELDTALLVFQNLPPDLKITASRWLKMKALKEELKRKRDAFLPRPPNNKSKRPNFARGKLFKDPGGLKAVDEVVKVGERFQQLCKGNHYFAKVLADWTKSGLDKKEDENLNFNFGSVPTTFKYGFSANRTIEEEEEEAASASTQKAVSCCCKDNKSPTGKPLPTTKTTTEGGKPAEVPAEGEDAKRFSSTGNANEIRESFGDGRKYQREMLQMEYMIIAIYDLIKSMLNIKINQLNSQLPLPVEVVMQLRDISPEPKEKKVVAPVKNVIVKRRRYGEKDPPPVENLQDEEEMEDSDDEACIELENELKASHEEEEEEIPKQTIRERLQELDPFHMRAADIIQRKPIMSSHRLLEEIKRVHAIQERAASLKQEQTAQAKIKTLVENPEHAAQRLARNAATYGRLFERREKPKIAIWQNVHVDQYVTKFAAKESVLTKDPTNLTDADAEEVVEMAIRKRQMLPSSKRWPDTDDIPTPTFLFAHSPHRVGSEEMSRRNLLSTMPHMDDIPSTPVRRLFKLAGVRTTEKQTFNTLLDMKRKFRSTEKKVRVYCQNEIFKMEFDTIRRYKARLGAIYPDPVYQWCILMMRGATKVSADEEGNIHRTETGGVRRQAMWYRKLLEECANIGATNTGCQQALQKLLKYSDIDVKSKPQLICRMALLVVSLPTTELGSRPWQAAIQFLLEHLFGAPKEALQEWLEYRRLPLVSF